MTQEKVAEFKAYLELKVKTQGNAANSSKSGQMRLVSAVRLEAYRLALAEFNRMSAEPEQKPEPTESLHEMAKRWVKAHEGGLRNGIFESDLRAWAAENPPKPVKTYKDDFFEKHADAPSYGDRYPVLPVHHVYKANREYFRRFDTTNTGDSKLFEGAWDKPLGYWEA